MRRMTDEELLAVPGIGETSLARIRRAFPEPKSGPDCVALNTLQLIFTRWKNAGHEPSNDELLALVDTARTVVKPEPSDPTECSGEAGTCPEHGHHDRSLKQSGESEADELARLREGLHKFRYALDSRAGRETTTDFIRAMLNSMLTDPGEPCDSAQQHARAEAAEATIARVRAEVARIRAVTSTWEPVADLIDAALDGTGRAATEPPASLPTVGTARIAVDVEAVGTTRYWCGLGTPLPSIDKARARPHDGREVGDV
ncbi:hypothetical protein ACFVT5_41385 [Streptomyces sp. NPDC058001]|uniref:hypothetical protein n=1 Tax=Streptomyces sp. NPDC058001 TaxID=3346300 RepID=UPI0036EA3451